jgi:hydrogenase maturation factor
MANNDGSYLLVHVGILSLRPWLRVRACACDDADCQSECRVELNCVWQRTDHGCLHHLPVGTRVLVHVLSAT